VLVIVVMVIASHGLGCTGLAMRRCGHWPGWACASHGMGRLHCACWALAEIMLSLWLCMGQTCALMALAGHSMVSPGQRLAVHDVWAWLGTGCASHRLAAHWLILLLMSCLGIRCSVQDESSALAETGLCWTLVVQGIVSAGHMPGTFGLVTGWAGQGIFCAWAALGTSYAGL
jgi:hypothetical protein